VDAAHRYIRNPCFYHYQFSGYGGHQRFTCSLHGVGRCSECVAIYLCASAVEYRYQAVLQRGRM